MDKLPLSVCNTSTATYNFNIGIEEFGAFAPHSCQCQIAKNVWLKMLI
jgi:hypothetical protein